MKEMALATDISHIYPLSSPGLFHKVLDILLLLNCFYLALWATNFVVIAQQLHGQALFQVMVVATTKS